MIHFSEFEKDLLEKMIDLDFKIISFDRIIQYNELFKNKGLALRESVISNEEKTILYIRRRKYYQSNNDRIKDSAIPFEIQHLYNYLLKERLIIQVDSPRSTWMLIGYNKKKDYILNADNTITFKNNKEKIDTNNEWKDEHGDIKYDPIILPKSSLDVSSFTAHFVPTQKLLDIINHDFKDDEEIKFDFELKKTEKELLQSEVQANNQLNHAKNQLEQSKEQAKKQNWISICAIIVAFLTPMFATKCCTSQVKMSEPIIVEQVNSSVEKELQEIKTSINVISEGVKANSQEIDSLSQTIKGVNRSKQVK